MKKELEYLILYLIKKHRDEIIRDGDWWYGIPEYSINVFDYSDKNVFDINVYKVGENGMDDYSECFSLPSLTLEEIKAL